MTSTLVLAFTAAFLYAVSSLFLKRGFQEGVGLLRTLFLGNTLMFLVVPYLALSPGGTIIWSDVYQPIVCGLFFFLGQTFTFVAIRSGDVSVVTPTMGAKVVFVGLVAALVFGREFSTVGWLAVILAGLAVGLLGLTRSPEGGRKSVLISIGLASLACVFFAVSDNMVAELSGAFGGKAFVSIVFVTAATASFGLIPFFRQPLRSIPGKGWFWVVAGGLLLAFQALLFNLALTHGEATQANILYSSRGLWSVVLVAWVGRWFGNREGELPRWMIGTRMAGAFLVLLAIFLLLFVA